MDACAKVFGPDIGDELRRQVDAQLAGLDAPLLGTRQQVDLVQGHGDAGDVCVHELRHAGGFQGDDARHDGHIDARLLHGVQEPLQALGVENALGLDVLRTGVHLLLQLVDLQNHRLIDGGDAGTLEEPGRGGQGIAAAVKPRLLHPGQHFQDADGIQIVDGLAVPAVADNRMVAGQRQDGVDAEGSGGKDVAHNGHAAPVPAGDLQNRLDARLLQVDAQAQGAGLQAGGLHIGDVDALDPASQDLGHLQLLGKITALGGRHLGGDGEFALLKGSFQLAHFFPSLRLM